MEEDDEDIISYSFQVSNGSIYSVYFDPYQYVKYTDRFRYLLHNGYGFGFTRVYKALSPWTKDPLIGTTIARIIVDFIETNGANTVLLYHCDFSDKKQKGRSMIFDQWHSGSDMTHLIKKRSLEVEKPLQDKKETNYIGYLTSCTNPDIVKVEDEFVIFVEDLIGNKP